MNMIARDVQIDEGPSKLVCVGVRQETSLAKTYVFKRADDMPMPFVAGQFLNFTFNVDGRDEQRSYSVSSSAAHDKRIAITVKRVEGGVVSNWLFDNLQAGHTVTASDPCGVFVTDDAQHTRYLFLSAGSGITPLASMMRTFVDFALDPDVTFLHFARSPEDMIFRDEFASWSRALPNSRIVPVAEAPSRGFGWIGPTGRLTPAMLDALIPDLKERQVFVCGPAGFMSLAESLCRSAGVPADAFFSETFTSSFEESVAEAPAEGETHEIRFEKSGKVVACGRDQTVLRAAQGAKVRIQTSCGKGVCGTCRVKVLSGDVEMIHGGGIRQREIDQGFILACCSRPKTDLVVER